MTEVDESAPFSGRSHWGHRIESPLRNFIRTESGSAAVLAGATVAALIWANVDASSYASVWHTNLTLRLGHWQISQSVRDWVNNGLMTFFFFVVGLEARREFDLGELRERRRVVLPLTAGIGGMIVPVLIYLAINAGHSSTHGWGTAMSTDTAFALGLLALVGRGLPDRVRVFLLTVVVVDDLVALLVIAIFYSTDVKMGPSITAIVIMGVVLTAVFLKVRTGLFYLAGGMAAWVAVHASGIDPVAVGLAMGLLTWAYAPVTADLEEATGLFRLFREQPTAELARAASAGVAATLSPNDLLQQRFHPWTSYFIVPLFALGNAGIGINAGFLSRAYQSPITLGILIGYVVGKPIGIVTFSWLVTKMSKGKLRPPVGWASIAGGGAIAGIGFTVSILIATLAFQGDQLEEAKLGVLTAALCAAIAAFVVFRLTAMLSPQKRNLLLLGTSEAIIDLAVPVDPDRDHIRGPSESLVTVVEYGDFECPYCGQAEPVVRELLAAYGEVRYVWRHLPLTDVHPRAELAAEATEVAADHGKFWEMHDLLLANQEHLRPDELQQHAESLGLDGEKFLAELKKHSRKRRIDEDLDSAGLSGVSGTPTFFINGQRHYGAYDINALKSAVGQAKARAMAANTDTLYPPGGPRRSWSLSRRTESKSETKVSVDSTAGGES
jgi:Na+/H+ antiporter NhaA